MATRTQTRTQRSAEDWIRLGVEYRELAQSGWSMKDFAREKNLSYKTMTDAFRRNKTAIEKNYKNSVKVKDRKANIINNFRKLLAARGKGAGKINRKKSEKWFKDKVMGNDGYKTPAKLTVGTMLTFMYDPKYKETLPFWDKYPAIIYLGYGKSPAGNKVMLGLNYHYLPTRLRQRFFEEMLAFASQKTFGPKLKLNIDWMSVKDKKYVKSLIKSYLPSHLKTPITLIPPTDYATMLYLPSYQFYKKQQRISASVVWADTIKRG